MIEKYFNYVWVHVNNLIFGVMILLWITSNEDGSFTIRCNFMSIATDGCCTRFVFGIRTVEAMYVLAVDKDSNESRIVENTEEKANHANGNQAKPIRT